MLYVGARLGLLAGIISLFGLSEPAFAARATVTCVREKTRALINRDVLPEADVIQRIAEIPSGGVIPRSIMDHVDSRTIGKAIVARLSRMLDRPRRRRAGEIAFDWKDNTEIHLLFNPKTVGLIKRHGFFNQHQSGRSRGAMTPDFRARLEDLLADLRVDRRYPRLWSALSHFVRPKYAMVEVKNDTDIGYRSSLGEWYGDYVAVLRNEVKERATWTANDSLLYGPHPFEGDLARREGIQGTFSSKYLDKSVRGGYIEAQIWGELTFRDVEYVMVPAGTSTTALRELRSLNIPIYEYTLVEVHGRPKRVKGRRLV